MRGITIEDLAGKALFNAVIAEGKWQLPCFFEWRHKQWLGYKTLGK